MWNKEHRLFLAGDALITKPWSHINNPLFLKIIEEMRNADTSIINLETLIHNFRGYAQADSGGAYMASPPEIATELKWAGVDMVSHANNHAFDYGSEGIIETHENANAAGIIVAGTGNDLQSARAAQYFTNNGTTVALVSMASTFIPYGAASLARPDLHGRPGLNPLALNSDKTVTVTREQARRLGYIAKLLGRCPGKYLYEEFQVRGIIFRVGEKNSLEWRLRVKQSDLIGNLCSIEKAASNADLTVVAIHAHQQGRWLRQFSYEALDKGADIIFVHGPHRVLGIELYRGKPIFYCMGDFVYQTDQISLLPTEAYKRVDLDELASVEEFHGDGKRSSMQRTRSVYEAFAATLDYASGKLNQIRLLPVDLQFDAKYQIRGRPQYADSKIGRSIIDQVVNLSSMFGTQVKYHPESNQAVIEIR